MMNWDTSALTWASAAPTTQLKVCCRCRAMEPVSVIAEVTLGRYVEALSRRSADAISSACDGSKKRG